MHSDNVSASEFSSNEKYSKQTASLKCVLYACTSVSKVDPHFADMFKLDSLVSLSGLSLSSTHFQLSLLNEPTLPCHSIICQSKSVFNHMEHVNFQ